METGSAASDEDFLDDEVDEVDEGDSEGSNGISDYDTSEEDHLLVQRASSCENKNNPASNVISSAAAGPEAPIVPAAHAAFEGPVASVAQSSAPKRVNVEHNSLNKNVSVSSDNVSTVSNDKVAAEQRKLRSHSGNNQETESEMRTNSSIGNSSIENCSGASKTEGISVPIVGKEAVANSPVSPSEPPGPSSSGSGRRWLVPRISPVLGKSHPGKTGRLVLALWRVLRQSANILGRPLSLGALRNSNVGVFRVVFRSTLNGHLYCYSKYQRVEGCEQKDGFHPMASPLTL